MFLISLMIELDPNMLLCVVGYTYIDCGAPIILLCVAEVIKEASS